MPRVNKLVTLYYFVPTYFTNVADNVGESERRRERPKLLLKGRPLASAAPQMHQRKPSN